MALVTLANVYTAIVEYNVDTDPSTTWRNTYDFYDSSTPTSTDPIIIALAAFAPTMIFDWANFKKISVYNWHRGAEVYPGGLPILEITYNVAGTAQSSWVFSGTQPVAGNEVCLRVDKSHVGIGKPGRLFFRNFVPASNINATEGGGWFLVSGSPITPTHFSSILTSTGMAVYLGGALHSGAAFVTVQYSKKHGTVSGSNYDAGWAIIGVSTNKASRRSSR